jgi:hypothetical protein
MASQSVLLVEGKDDLHVLNTLLEHHAVPMRFAVQQMEGIKRLLENVAVRLKLTDMKSLGIVLDADVDLGSPWASLGNSLRAAGYANVPDEPAPNGTIVQPPDGLHPVVGIWLMPDNKLPGILEDFLMFLVPDGDSLLEYAKAATAGIPSDLRRFKAVDRVKAEMHAWLAWQKKPGLPFGASITAKYLSADATQAKGLIDWVRRVFIV